MPIYSKKKIFEDNIRTSVSHRMGGNRKHLYYRRKESKVVRNRLPDWLTNDNRKLYTVSNHF